jgi:signal transduction histidine kinase
MLDDPAKIGQATYEGLKQLLNIDLIFWYDYVERGSLLQLEYYFGNLPEHAVPQTVKTIDLSREMITLGDQSDIKSMETKLAENIRHFINHTDFNGQIIPISIFLKRALAGVAILTFPPDFDFSPALRELAVLALSQTAAIYQRQRAVLNATQLVTMGRLLADIGHDLKKPLTNLKGSLQIYKTRIEGKQARDFFPEAEKEVNRLSELVKEMVEFANPNKYQTRKIDIAVVLEKSLDLLKSDLIKKEITVVRDFSKLPQVMLNDREMYQVFINIILNAVDSMEVGGRLGLKGRSLTDDSGEWVRLEFEDSGCGIPEESINRIFSRYYTTKQTGTGLGLAIVERIVSVHNGRINVRSKPGEGTVFTIDLRI